MLLQCWHLIFYSKYQIPTLKYDYYSVPLPNIIYNTSSIVLSKTAYTWYTNDILWSICNQRITRAMLFSNGKQPFSWTSPPISNSLLSQTLTTTSSRRAQRGNFLSIVQYINWIFLTISYYIGARSAENFQTDHRLFLRNS